MVFIHRCPMNNKISYFSPKIYLMYNRLYTLLTIIFCFCYSTSGAQIIITFAGNATFGFGGDNVSATTTPLNFPNGIAIDASGNVYIADRLNYRIRKVDPAGIITTVAGTGTPGFSGDGGPATAAKLDNALDVAFDSVGNLYISDQNNDRIRKVDTAGIITTVAGSSSGYSGDGGPATIAQLSRPWGICFDASGNLYISDEINGRVRMVNTSGIINTIAGTGTSGFSADGVPATASDINHPADIITDAAGNIYFADFYNNRIRKVDPAGIISTVAGNGVMSYSGDGAAATMAALHWPIGIEFDQAGNMYIGDSRNNVVRKVDGSGIISTVAGIGSSGFSGDGGLATLAQLNYVYNIAFDISGSMYIGDASNHRVRKIPGTNHAPHFTGGPLQNFTVCQNSGVNPVNSLLAVLDTDISQTVTWAVSAAPMHGTLVASYSALSTSGVVIPIGLSYSPTAGYTGNDSFIVAISDGMVTDTTKVYVTVNPMPDAGIITGVDSVCPGDTVVLSDTAAGGVWVSSNVKATVVAGIVTGITPGLDTILYIRSNSCGSDTAAFTLKVRSLGSCASGIFDLGSAELTSLDIVPNPNKGSFTINLRTPDEKQVHFSVFNVLGARVIDINAMTNEEINITTSLAPGLYMVTAQAGSTVSAGKLIIE